MPFFALSESSIFASTEVRAPTRTNTLERSHMHAVVYINGRRISPHLPFIYILLGEFFCERFLRDYREFYLSYLFSFQHIVIYQML